MGFISWVKGAAKKVGEFGRGVGRKVGEFASKVPGAIQKVGKFATDVGGTVKDVAHWINTTPAAQSILDAAGMIPGVGSVAKAIQMGARQAEKIGSVVEKGGQFASDVSGALASKDISKFPSLYERGRELYGEAQGLRR